MNKNNHDEKSEALGDQWIVKHTHEFWVQRTSARVNNLAHIYFDIAQESFGDYLVASKDPNVRNDSQENFEQHMLAEKRVDQSALKTIVFAAMTCEAAIYDVAAVQLSDEYARNVLDRLDPVSKWLVTPRLICGRSLSEKGPAINSLRALFGARNELVHAKSLSGFGLDDPEQFRKIEAASQKQAEKILSAVVPSYQTVVLLSLELQRLFGTASASLPFFASLSRSPAYDDASEEVRKVIRRCKEIDANSMKSSSS